MRIFNRLHKLLVVSLAIFLVGFFLITDRADAKDIIGGFAASTKIATSDGDVSVENLQVGDRVISYNFETHHTADRPMLGS